MECPHCHTRNLPHAEVCTHCGIILKPVKDARPAPRYKPHAADVAKAVLRANALRAQHALANAKFHDALGHAEQHFEKDLDRPDSAPRARSSLAATHLLRDSVERSIEDFEQARRQGVADAAFYNNLGAALARRGRLSQSAEMFQRASAQDPDALAPHANLARVFALGCAGPDPQAAEQALRQVQILLQKDPRNPIHYNRLGLILCREQRYDEAVVHFQRAVALAEDAPLIRADALTDLGLAQWRCGDHAAAKDAFAAALALDPGHGHALGNQGLTHLLEGDTDGAFRLLSKASRLDPHSAQIHNNLGCLLARLGAVNDAILAFREAVRLDPQLFEAEHNLGKAYADQGLPEVADPHLTRALQLHPRSWQGYVTLGVVKAQEGQALPATQCFQAADRLAHNNALIQANLGVTLALAGEYAEAARHLHQAAVLDKDNPEIGAHLGWVALLQDDVLRAADELLSALNRDERMPHAHNNYGLCRLSQVASKSDADRAQSALRHFRRALELDPGLGPVHYNAGIAYAMLDQMDAALKEWDQAARAEPTNADCFANLGVAAYRRNSLDDAVTHFRHVVTLRQTRMEDFYNLGLAYGKQAMDLRAASTKPQDAKAKAAQEKGRQAVDMFDRALALDPRSVILHSNRGLACFLAGRPEESMQAWATVTKLDPEYIRKRGRAHQTEFDHALMHLVALSAPERALALPLRTAPYLDRFSPGYDTEEWELMLSEPLLMPLPALSRRARHLERSLHAAQI